MPVKHVLHLVGSPTDIENYDLSLLYAKDCITALSDPFKYQFSIAVVGPDGLWRFPEQLHVQAIQNATAMTQNEALLFIASLEIDVALPQMFCFKGMTDYRSLLDSLRIPFLGNLAEKMALTADKAKTKAIVSAAGVYVPYGEIVLRGQSSTLRPPVVVKPNTSDNSDGVSFVSRDDEYPAALKAAFKCSETVLVEDYIQLGREVRCGIVVESGELRCLPLEEYYVNTNMRPVRRRMDKLRRDVDNTLFLAAKSNSESWIVDQQDAVNVAVWDAAKRCHVALGCRHYSLFDFRIDPMGTPWFLEAGLYCSFSPKSVISTMMDASGTPLDEFFSNAINEAIA
jgi:D-alanine-D-alanine ligase